MEDLIADLNGATVFSKIDLNQGYHQLEQQRKTAYALPLLVHMFRYKWLSFGVNSAAEMFQKSTEVLQGIEGIRNISDDIIMFDKSQTDHGNPL